MISVLDEIEFHDSTVKSIQFDYENDAVGLIVKAYDETAKIYFDINLLFNLVSDFHIDEVEDFFFSEIGNIPLQL